MVQKDLFPGRNRDANVRDRHVDMVEEGEGETN